MTPVKMGKNRWINPERHSIAVDDQKLPVLNENGDLIILDNTTRKCIVVPNTEDVLEIFGFEYSSTCTSPSGSPKESTPNSDMKKNVQVVRKLEPLLWSSRTPSQKDIEATREMLALVGSKRFQNMFNDQCTVKIRVWKLIYEELVKKGFRIADSVNEGGIKCHQKWRNLEKTYKNYLITLMDLNSPTPKRPPPYFEMMHDILKTTTKYADAVACMQTVVVNSNMMDPDTSVDGGQLTDSDGEEELDYTYGQNNDHCYVVVGANSAQMSKRMKVKQLPDNLPTSSSSISGCGGPTPSSNNWNNSQDAVVPQSPQHSSTALEQILKKVQLVQKDMQTIIEWQNVHLEKVMQENTVEKERLVDVCSRLLTNTQGDNKASTSDVN